MRNTKTIILLSFLIFILIIILVLKNLTRLPSTSTTQPSQSLQETLTIQSTNLSTQPVGITELIRIKFSKPVQESTLKILIIPQTPATIYFDSSKTNLTIDPKDAWNFDTTYQLFISKETKSQKGISLDKDYIYNFKTIKYSGI